MGARSGGGGDTGLERDSNYKGQIKNVEGLKNMKDRQLYNEMKSAISRFYKEMGIPSRNVNLADLTGVYGIGGEDGVYLNKKHFKNSDKKTLSSKIKNEYANGHLTKTNKPVAHILTHELAHTVWNNDMNGTKHIAAGKEIRKVYNAWKKSKKTGYGKYAGTNVSEFFAEAVTKGIHGKADKYTKALKKIVKKYKL